MGILDLFGGDTRREDRLAEERVKAISDLYQGMPLPELQQLDPETIQEIGPLEVERATAPNVGSAEQLTYTPVDTALADVYTQGPTNLAGIEVDPRLVDAQMGALTSLQGIADSGGLTLADEAALNRIQSQTAQADRGRREAIMQNMRASGMGGSGMDLLAQLQSSQAATDSASQQGLDVAGMAQQRALDAIMRGGGLAGDIRGQQFGEQATIRSAQDEIDAFNAANLTRGSQFNTSAINQGNQFNASNELGADQFNIATDVGIREGNANRTAGVNQFNAGQGNSMTQFREGANAGIRGQNVDIRNTAQETNRIGIPQQQFQNRMGIAGGKAQGYGAEADMYGSQADRKKKEAAETFGALVKGGTALYTGGK